MRQFSFRGGIPSHVAPETPGSIHEGGELGYCVSHAYGAAFDNPTYSGPPGTYFSDFTEIRNEERRAVEHLLSPCRSSFPGVRIEITAARGNPVPILIEAARDTRLLVVGAHRHRGPLSVGAGYTVDALLAHCPTPVAVVPTH
jgi:nucleotide-binding universal stress UspA family protein